MEVNYYSRWVGRWSDKTKVILNSTQFKFRLVEVGVELGNINTIILTCKDCNCHS